MARNNKYPLLLVRDKHTFESGKLKLKHKSIFMGPYFMFSNSYVNSKTISQNTAVLYILVILSVLLTKYIVCILYHSRF